MTRVAEPQATFSAEEAARAASEAVEEQAQRNFAEARAEAEASKAASREYAEHLAAGGVPTQIPSRSGSDVTLDRLGQLAVYRLWNVARGSPNPLDPFHAGKWLVAEALFDRFGEPITYAELAAIHGGGRFSSTKPPSEEIGRVIIGVERLAPTVVGRRTKVGGKVAFFLRDRQEGDPAVGAYRYDEIPEEKS